MQAAAPFEQHFQKNGHYNEACYMAQDLPDSAKHDLYQIEPCIFIRSVLSMHGWL